jgi:hypothetical protein
MATLTIIDNEFVTLWYHEDSKIVHHQFHKFLFGEPFRECLSNGVETLRKYKAEKWLSDDRNNSAIPKEDFDWSTNEWRPDAIEAGWRFWALVLPESVVGQMSLTNIIRHFYQDGPVRVELFSDPDEAVKWLEAQ